MTANCESVTRATCKTQSDNLPGQTLNPQLLPYTLTIEETEDSPVSHFVDELVKCPGGHCVQQALKGGVLRCGQTLEVVLVKQLSTTQLRLILVMASLKTRLAGGRRKTENTQRVKKNALGLLIIIGKQCAHFRHVLYFYGK